jgi:hypothetical protein
MSSDSVLLKTQPRYAGFWQFANRLQVRADLFGDSEPMASAVSVEEGQPYLILKGRIDDFSVSLMIDTGCDDVVVFANRVPKGLKKGYFTESGALTITGNAAPTQIGFGNLAGCNSSRTQGEIENHLDRKQRYGVRRYCRSAVNPRCMYELTKFLSIFARLKKTELSLTH